jgi:protease I
MARIAVLVADDFEDSELSEPVKALKKAGHKVDILGVEAKKKLVGKRHDEKVKTDAAVDDCSPEQYDALLIPGGHSPDHLRMHHGSVQFVKRFGELERPIAAICHGPQLLIEAGLVEGRHMTSWPSVRTDLANAGAKVEDKTVVEDGPLITSRMPGDLDAFSRALLARLEAREQQNAQHA